MNESARVAIFSIERNSIISEIETDVESTLHSDMFTAKIGSKKVAVWLVDENMELNIDRCYEYVWFNK
jgi:hypothetical protein